MNTIEISGKNRLPSVNNERIGCRGIVIDDGKILLSYEVNTDQWFIPGGGLEKGENLEECCIRELAEETGYLVLPQKQFLTINEYYQDWLFVSHYFICEVAGKTERKLTQREVESGLIPKWIPLDEAVRIFSTHADYDGINEMKRGAYYRELNALEKLNTTLC